MSAKSWGLFGLIAGVLTLVVLIGFAFSFHPVRGLELSPNSIVPDKTPIEGDHVTFEVVLKNPNTFPVILGEISASCGCSKVSRRSGKELKQGDELPAGGCIDLAIIVNTTGQVLSREVRVQIGARTPTGLSIPFAHATIKVPVKGGPRVEPLELVFKDIQPGKQTLGEILVADGQDAPVTYSEVKFADPERFSGKLIPIEPTSADLTGPMKPRFRLEVTCRKSENTGMITSFIDLVPAQSRFAPIRIPIYCSSANRVAGFVPESLVLVRQPGDKTINRKIVLKTGKDIDDEVRVISSPPFISVELGKRVPGQQEMKLKIDLEALASSGESSRLVLGVGKDSREHSLEVKLLSP